VCALCVCICQPPAKRSRSRHEEGQDEYEVEEGDQLGFDFSDDEHEQQLPAFESDEEQDEETPEEMRLRLAKENLLRFGKDFQEEDDLDRDTAISNKLMQQAVCVNRHVDRSTTLQHAHHCSSSGGSLRLTAF
jgi:hypothetical protein